MDLEMVETLPVTTEYVPCDLCGSTDHELLFSKIDPVTGHEFHLVHCSCGMALVNPMPTEESMPLWYPHDYHEHKELKSGMHHSMLRFIQVASGRKLLDIGCGRGDFIHLASQAGWDVCGVENVEWDSPFTVPVHVGDFLTMDFPERTYDVITAWAVLEHVRQPSKFFERVSKLLSDQGLFVFLVPNIAAPGMRVACAEDIPRHLWHFSPKAVREYLGKYGMRVASIAHNSAIYSAYPFGLLRYAFHRLGKNDRKCIHYQNGAVALLRNRQLKGNLGIWLAEVRSRLTFWEMAIDAADLALGVAVAQVSKLIRNYGVITVTAERDNSDHRSG